MSLRARSGRRVLRVPGNVMVSRQHFLLRPAAAPAQHGATGMLFTDLLALEWSANFAPASSLPGMTVETVPRSHSVSRSEPPAPGLQKVSTRIQRGAFEHVVISAMPFGIVDKRGGSFSQRSVGSRRSSVMAVQVRSPRAIWPPGASVCRARRDLRGGLSCPSARLPAPASACPLGHALQPARRSSKFRADTA